MTLLAGSVVRLCCQLGRPEPASGSCALCRCQTKQCPESWGVRLLALLQTWPMWRSCSGSPFCFPAASLLGCDPFRGSQSCRRVCPNAPGLLQGEPEWDHPAAGGELPVGLRRSWMPLQSWERSEFPSSLQGRGGVAVRVPWQPITGSTGLHDIQHQSRGSCGRTRNKGTFVPPTLSKVSATMGLPRSAAAKGGGLGYGLLEADPTLSRCALTM